MTAPFCWVHRVRLEEIDAAGLVYFARYFSWCHDAMADMLAPLAGGYAGLLVGRRLGLPAVHVEADYRAPLRFGDEVRIMVHVERIGASSVTLRFEIDRAPQEVRVAMVRHVVVLTDLDAMRAHPFPADLRALLEGRSSMP
ncbi:MAG: acyl-CoA thioesterase [Myxococcota bacterium]|nr:acyl-CoA thioesterase [Myxococcota bacterium]